MSTDVENAENAENSEKFVFLEFFYLKIPKNHILLEGCGEFAENKDFFALHIWKYQIMHKHKQSCIMGVSWNYHFLGDITCPL